MTMEPKSRELLILAEGAGINLAGRSFGRGLTALTQVVLARALGPAAFGFYAIGWSLLKLGNLIAPLGLDHGVIRYASHLREQGRTGLRGIFLPALAISAGIGALLGGVLFATASFLATDAFEDAALVGVLRWFSPGIALAAVLAVAAAATRVSQRMGYAVVAEEVVQPVSHLLLFGAAFLLGWGLLGAVGAAVVSLGLGAALALFWLARLFPEAFTGRG